MSTYIDSIMIPICKFLGDVVTLRVPAFQRDYAWTDDEVGQLWTDITDAMDTQQSEYFLGPMVLKKTHNKYEIIDGQQRFATVYIILSIIRRIIRENGDNERADWFNNKYFGQQNVETLIREPKFHMNEINDPVFQKFISADAGKSILQKEMKGRLKKDPNYLLLLGISTIWEMIEKRQKDVAGKDFDLDTLLSVEKYLSENVSLLILTVTDEADAYIIFETLNDRGLGLSTMDLLKNQVFGKCGENLDQVKSYWSVIRDNLSGIDPRERFIHHYWTSYYGRTSKSKLFRLMRKKITTPKTAVAFAENLCEASKIYSAINSPSHPLWNSYSQDTRQNLEILNMLNAQQTYPILLAAKEKFDEKEFGKLTSILVVMAIRYNLIGELRTGVASNYYVEIPPRIRSGELPKSAKVFRSLKPLYPSDHDFELAFSTKVLKDAKKARYLLSALEEYQLAGKQKISSNTAKVNLEQVVPRNPTNEWKDTISSIGIDDLDDYIHRIGNLALVSTVVNKNVGSKGFKDKKSLLFSKETAIKFTNMIADYPEWSKITIEDRQKKLAKVAVKVWKISIT